MVEDLQLIAAQSIIITSVTGLSESYILIYEKKQNPDFSSKNSAHQASGHR